MRPLRRAGEPLSRTFLATALAAISNGILASKVASGSTTTWHWDEDKPMASYLAFVAIGNYRVHSSTHDGMPVVSAVDASLPSLAILRTA